MYVAVLHIPGRGDTCGGFSPYKFDVITKDFIAMATGNVIHKVQACVTLIT